VNRLRQLLDVLRVLDTQHVPSLGGEALEMALGVERDRRRAVDRDVVVVVAERQLAEPEVAGDRSRFLADPLHQVAIGADRVRAVVDELVPWAVEALREETLGERETDGVADALPERTGRHLDARRVAALRVPGRTRAPLAELLQIVERQVVAAQVKQRVLQHARVPRAEHEAVAIGPVRVVRVRLEEALEQRVAERRERHRRAGVTRVGLLHGVHRQPTDRVNRQLADLVLVH
jgi:hypothetical protein